MEILIFLLIIILFSLYAEKNGYYANIMLDAPTIALCPKLCRHNVSNPNSGPYFIHVLYRKMWRNGKGGWVGGD